MPLFPSFLILFLILIFRWAGFSALCGWRITEVISFIALQLFCIYLFFAVVRRCLHMLWQRKSLPTLSPLLLFLKGDLVCVQTLVSKLCSIISFLIKQFGRLWKTIDRIWGIATIKCICIFTSLLNLMFYLLFI